MVQQWMIDNRRAAGWSEAEINAWIASSATPPTTGAHTVITPDGTPFTTTLSQYWVDPNYSGSEPTNDVKATYSTADYARDNAATIARAYVNAGIPVSTMIKDIAQNYPDVTYSQGPEQGQQTGSADMGAFLLSSMTSTGYGLVAWLQQNLLLIIIVVAGIIIVPNVVRAATRTRR